MEIERGNILVLRSESQKNTDLHNYLQNSILDTDFYAIKQIQDDQLENEMYDLVVIDFADEVEIGYQLVDQIRQHFSKMERPIIAINPPKDQKAILLDGGANDFVSSGANPRVLRSRIRTHISFQKHWEQLASRANYDSLTGLLNRWEFMNHLEKEIVRFKRYDSTFSFALLDLDQFKPINDDYGHTTGDLVLEKLGALIQQNIRFNDKAGRYGGDEFCIIFPETGVEEARNSIVRIQRSVQNTTFQSEEHNEAVEVTFCVGLTAFSNEHDDVKSFVNATDKLLYKAKAQGRNNICVGQ